ncbi:unnamed protein product [Spirodela intermedia]|uniref:Uncharacterized protein n=1 Tax=Spirodela intermedia TaxID=51605 RepID=A0A7I8JMQ3_SPIIN|nr:unnamed protein product [Spirodela intermedia]CAA6670742.1 unnamed protein product [Spirodela intermedia]
MAETLILILTEKIASALADQLEKQFDSLYGLQQELLTQVRGRMSQIKMEFEVIKGFLIYIGTRKENNEILDAWVKEVRELAFEAETIMDHYTYIWADQRHSSNVSRWYHINNQLQEISNRLHRLGEMKQQYDIKTTKGSQSKIAIERHQDLTRSSRVIDEETILGTEEYEKDLKSWLKGGQTDVAHSKRILISVSGPVGIGKTTLVSKVYRSTMIRESFGCRAWVNVSRTYKVEDLHRRIVRELFKGQKGEIPQRLDTMDSTELKKILDEFLGNMRYLIVLDDMRDQNVWKEKLENFIPDNNCGSRIIMTTQSVHVASLAGEDRIMQVKKLGEQDALYLFCRKAFQRHDTEECPTELMEQARNISKMCDGLPLAVVSMGNYLSLREKTILEWKKLEEDLNWILNNNVDFDLMKSVLKLSFDSLPGYLKTCFLYCGIFPDSHLIKRKRLIRLWIAEGFIQDRGRRTAEDVAEDNLHELIKRNMLEVQDTNDSGRVRTCKISAIMRQLIISKSEQEDFYVVFEDAEKSYEGNARRFSVKSSNNSIPFGISSIQNLRSWIHFGTGEPPLQSGFKLLRVLDLQGVPLIKGLPKEIFNLFNLHYLGLRNTSIKRLSTSIKRLVNLQTLDLAFTNIKELPDGIVKLRRLRHLFVYKIVDRTYQSFCYFLGFPALRGICDLKELHTLQSVEVSKDILRNLKKMSQLRSFRIMKVRAEHYSDLSKAIETMVNLRRLDIVGAKSDEALDMTCEIVPPQSLEKLTFRAKLMTLPTWISSLRNLAWVRLCWCSLPPEQDFLPSLGGLHSLVFLLLINAHNGSELSFKNGSFLRLKDLRIVDMKNLKEIKVESGALNELRHLNLVRCEGLTNAPKGILSLKNLENVHLENMKREFVDQLWQTESDNHPMLRAVNIVRQDSKWELKSLGKFRSNLMGYDDQNPENS